MTSGAEIEVMQPQKAGSPQKLEEARNGGGKEAPLELLEEAQS